ncbi:MAG: hypothetical protein FWE18_00180 [Alphaproteobacteria bacterium]|nr:hypothetical protein [Alphaproteobacteria bacterium]
MFFKKVRIKKFDELSFKDQLMIFQEVMNLANYGGYLLLNKTADLINKDNFKNSKIFTKEITFKESFNYFKEVLEILGLEEKTFEVWGTKIFYDGVPLANLDKSELSPKLLEDIINVLANQYAAVWQEKIDTFYNYDSILYENLMNKPLDSIEDYIYLKEHEKKHNTNKGI